LKKALTRRAGEKWEPERKICLAALSVDARSAGMSCQCLHAVSMRSRHQMGMRVRGRFLERAALRAYNPGLKRTLDRDQW